MPQESDIDMKANARSTSAEARAGSAQRYLSAGLAGAAHHKAVDDPAGDHATRRTTMTARERLETYGAETLATEDLMSVVTKRTRRTARPTAPSAMRPRSRG